MVNDIKSGIANELAIVYPNITVYSEAVPQNFEPPCFSIILVNGSNARESASITKRSYNMAVHYYPASLNNPNEELEQVENLLYECLEIISVGATPVRGFDMSSTISDGVLVFSIRYPIRLREIFEKTKMQEVNINAKSKNS